MILQNTLEIKSKVFLGYSVHIGSLELQNFLKKLS